MDNKPLHPSSNGAAAASGAAAPPDDDAAGLNATHVTTNSGTPEIDSAGPVSSARLNPSSNAVVAGDRNISQLGDYLLLKKIGSGAMGAVYKARQVSTQRDVALKVLFQHVADNPKLVERFHREAKVTTALNHPNIVHGLDCGEDLGFHYFAMEFVGGESLQKWLARVGRLSLGDALYIILNCARALEHAHANDIVHRDIKPDNILITREGVPKVGDFGMVKVLDEEMSLTQTGHAVGTPWYMPLEQAKNAKDTDGRCDIYALGCVFYACLTGRPPFTGKTLVEVIQAKERGSFPPARQCNKEVPERVDLILAKMTLKKPGDRYQTCADLIKDLESVGLANISLSFLHAPAPATMLAGDAVTPRPDTLPATSRTPIPGKSSSGEADLWYVLYRNTDGKPVKEKLTTEQVLQLAEQPTFDPGNAKASRQANEGFRALATFREFQRVLGRASKSIADKQTFRQRKLMSQLVEQENQRAEQKLRPATTKNYWTRIAWRWAAACLGGGLVLLALIWAIKILKGIF
jgi:eukaryotic-like serine/threonine-protein kinase